MIRVFVICEGQTEELFVNELLAAPFQAQGIMLIPALIGKPGHKGGNFKFDRLLPDIRNRLRQDHQAYCTTFFDFYGLPESFPGKKAQPESAPIEAKATAVHTALVERLTEKLGQHVMRRFIPFVQMYEFEALLFSDPKKLASGIDRLDLTAQFEAIANNFNSPERINNSPQTAPSKRILSLVDSYEKPLMGSLAAIEIGLDTMRKKCHLFNSWLEKIEALATE